MGFLKGLLGLGVTAGAAFAALKVAQKYEENKAADAAAAAAGAEPQDVPAGSVLEDIARAAGGVLSDAGAKVKEVVTGTAEKAGVDTVELKGALHDAGDALYEAGDAVADAGSAFAGYVAEEAPAVAGRLRDGAEDLLERVKETVAAGAQAVEEAADAAQAAAAEEATEQAEAAAQAEEKPEKGTAAEAATAPFGNLQQRRFRMGFPEP